MHFASLCNILSKTSFADLDIPCSKQLRETRADNPTKMLPLPWQYNRNQKVPGSPTAAMSADYVSCRHVCVALFGSSANGLCEPIAPSHALISVFFKALSSKLFPQSASLKALSFKALFFLSFFFKAFSSKLYSSAVSTSSLGVAMAVER